MEYRSETWKPSDEVFLSLEVLFQSKNCANHCF